MPPEKQERIARETMEIYAPLANRLGIQWIKVELEDLSFKYLYPKEYEELVEQGLALSPASGRPTSTRCPQILHDELAEGGIKCQVYGRAKHLWSIYQKMKKTGRELEQLYDILAFRVHVDSVRACYDDARHRALEVDADAGALQGLHRAAQAQHVSVAAHHGDRPARRADGGADPHRRRCTASPRRASRRTGATKRQSRDAADKDGKRFAWLRQLMEWQRDLKDPDRVHRDRQDRPVRRRGLRLHAQGRREGAAQGRDPDRSRLRDPLARSGSTVRARASTA